jgi:hypothetical protein
MLMAAIEPIYISEVVEKAMVSRVMRLHSECGSGRKYG